MPRYQFEGDFVCHDVRYVDRVTMIVDLDEPPTNAQAESMLYPLAEEKIIQREGYWCPLDFTKITVRKVEKTEEKE